MQVSSKKREGTPICRLALSIYALCPLPALSAPQCLTHKAEESHEGGQTHSLTNNLITLRHSIPVTTRCRRHTEQGSGVRLVGDGSTLHLQGSRQCRAALTIAKANSFSCAHCLVLGPCLHVANTYTHTALCPGCLHSLHGLQCFGNHLGASCPVDWDIRWLCLLHTS